MTSKNVHFNTLKQLGTFRLAEKDEFLYNPERIDQYVYCLEEGVCALISLSKNGEEKIYQYFKPGDLLGFVPAYAPTYEDDTFSAFSLVSKSQCKLYEIPYHIFCQFIETHPELYVWLVQMTIHHYDGVLAHLYHLQEGDNFSNLCKVLLELASYEDGLYMLHKYFSYVELAKYIDVHVVTVTRMMKRLKEEQIIYKLGHQTVICDRERLIAYTQ